MKKIIFSLVLFCYFTPHLAAESFISSIKPKVKQPTKVMVLGTMHLRGAKQPLPFNALAPVLDKFQHFRPDAIAVETLRPFDISVMTIEPQSYQSVLSQFVGDNFMSMSEKIKESLNQTDFELKRSLTSLLSSKLFTDKWHNEVILHAIAAKHKATALLHYGYLKDRARELPVEVEEYLSNAYQSNNEIKLLAVNLAMRNKLVELSPIDDHLDKDQYSAVMTELAPSFKNSAYVKTLAHSEYVQKPIKLLKDAVNTGDWVTLYQWMNSKSFQQQVINIEWRSFIDQDMPVKPSLARIALWEVRNLNMISNIMREVTNNIGGNIVVIVGANHKVFFEAYLNNMIGVELVQFNEL